MEVKRRMVYELHFSYYDENPENDDDVIIAVYSSYEKAEAGRKKFLKQPRFKGKEDFLEISEFKINEPWWDEGFWRATKSYFMIDLLNGYVIEKEKEHDPENHKIKIRNEEETQIYHGIMDLYYDHKYFLCLKNIESGKMYCLDKQIGKIQYETNSYEDMLKFLNQRYQIKIFGWKDIFRK